MTAEVLIWVAAVAFLFLAWPLAQRLKHPAMKPIAAWLVFVSAFALVGAAAFLALLWGFAGAGVTTALYEPVWAAVTSLVAIGLAFAAARYAVRRTPRRTGPPP
jgi:hypothetical protein